MGTIRARRGFLFVCLAFAVALATWAQAATLPAVREAITRQGLSWTAGETSVSGLTEAEKARLVGGLKGGVDNAPVWQSSKQATELPTAFSWRSRDGQNYVTPVRNQHSCGSCYIFGTVAALESQLLITYARPGQDVDLSEQVVLSCDPGAGNCTAGGYASRVATYLEQTGVPLETCYPYIAAEGSCGDACANWQQAPYKLLAYSILNDQTIKEVKTALLTTGPLTAWMDVFEDFYDYTDGVYSYATGVEKGGHFVLLVGWDDEKSAFLCKNSWGTGWGEAGFFWIAYSQMSNSVGFASYAVVLNGAVWPSTAGTSPAPMCLLLGDDN